MQKGKIQAVFYRESLFTVPVQVSLSRMGKMPSLAKGAAVRSEQELFRQNRKRGNFVENFIKKIESQGKFYKKERKKNKKMDKSEMDK